MSIFNLFKKRKDSALPFQDLCMIMNADEMEESRSISFFEEDEDWDDDDDDDNE